MAAPASDVTAMMGGLSVASIVVGAAVGYVAPRYPRFQVVIETIAGILLIAGLGVLGYALGCILDRP